MVVGEDIVASRSTIRGVSFVQTRWSAKLWGGFSFSFFGGEKPCWGLVSLFVCLFLYFSGPKKLLLGTVLSNLLLWSKVIEAPVLVLFWFLRYWSMISMIKERKHIPKLSLT